MPHAFSVGARVRSILFVTFLALTTTMAQDVHPQVGSTSFPFLNLGYDARAIAMGGAAAGMPNQLSGVMSNPSAIAFLQNRQILLGYRPIILDVRGAPLAYGMPLVGSDGKYYGVGALNFVYMSFGVVDDIDGSGQSLGTQTGEVSFGGGVSWARVIWEDLAVGATVKWLHDRFHGLSTAATNGLAADLGAQYRLAQDRLIVGIVLKNLGVVVDSYGENIDGELPLTATIGMSYQPRYVPRARFAVDMEKPTDDYLKLRGGLEIDIYDRILYGRIGYALTSEDLRSHFSTLTGSGDGDYVKTDWSSIRFGVGINLPINSQVDASIDAAYEARVDKAPPTFALSGCVSF